MWSNGKCRTCEITVLPSSYIYFLLLLFLRFVFRSLPFFSSLSSSPPARESTRSDSTINSGEREMRMIVSESKFIYLISSDVSKGLSGNSFEVSVQISRETSLRLLIVMCMKQKKMDDHGKMKKLRSRKLSNECYYLHWMDDRIQIQGGIRKP